jgi:hypothetical protein
MDYGPGAEQTVSPTVANLMAMRAFFFFEKDYCITKHTNNGDTDAEISRTLEKTQETWNKSRKTPEERKNYKQDPARSFCRRQQGHDQPPPPQDAGIGREPPSIPTTEVTPSSISGFVSQRRSPP